MLVTVDETVLLLHMSRAVFAHLYINSFNKIYLVTVEKFNRFWILIKILDKSLHLWNIRNIEIKENG